MTTCAWCGRTVAVIYWSGARALCRHDNRNNSGFCKGSLLPDPHRHQQADKQGEGR